MGIDARVSGTKNPLVTSTVFLKVLGNEVPDWKTPMFSLRSEGANVNVLSQSYLSVADHDSDLLVAAFYRNLISYTHQPKPLWYLAS